MTLKDLRTEAWDVAREVGTTDDDRYWTTKEMNRYINRVYRFIARETKCIRDDITTDICRITVAPYASLAELESAAATDAYAAQDLVYYNNLDSWMYNTLVAPYSFPLDPRILDIDEVKWTNKAWKLTHVSVTKWQVNPFWEQVVGMPIEYATDLATNRIAINYRAVDSDTLRLTVRRMPLADMALDADTPEFRTQYHDFMLNGILWQMYSKQDVEVADKDKADKYYTLFMKDVDEIKQQEKILNQMLSPNYSMDAFR